MRSATRFPICPKPKPQEALTSWLLRIAGFYRISVETLFSVGFEFPKPTSWWDLDATPTDALVVRIAKKTGYSTQIIRSMTLQSYVPDVIEGLEPLTESRVLLYTHAFSILGSKPYKGRVLDRLTKYHPWMRIFPRKNKREWNQYCPHCVQDPNISRPLFWRTTLVSTCPKHRCFLVDNFDGEWDRSFEPSSKFNVSRFQLWLDAVTINALETGIAKLWNERIPLRIWCRFLKSLQRELLVKKSTKRHKRIWKNAAVKQCRGNVTEKMTIKERSDIACCTAYLLHDWPKRLLDYMWLPKGIQSRCLPFFIARHLDFLPTSNGIFVFDQRYNCDTIFGNSEFLKGYALRNTRVLHDLLLMNRAYQERKRLIECLNESDSQKRAGAEAYPKQETSAAVLSERSGASAKNYYEHPLDYLYKTELSKEIIPAREVETLHMK